MRKYRFILPAILLACHLPSAARGDDAAARTFDDTVAPVLIRRCIECHGGADPKGGLDLSRAKTAMAGGESGLAIVPGKLDDSYLWERVDGDEMPPKKPLTDDEKKILRDWIASGAAWGTDPLDPFRFTTGKRAGYDWWALQPVENRPLPSVDNGRWPRNGIDRFILAKLEANALGPSPEADRRTLIRRLSFDLHGLPPTPEEVARFESESIRNPQSAYRNLVDRLLASPHYGVRWARHWLDVARFGESHGFERDQLRNDSWPYRDWVINALNDDMPYDEFVRQQIAGDVLYPSDGPAIVATGFLVAGPYDQVGQSQQSAAMKAVVRQDELEDIVSVVGQTFLGLTINCARCHDHKFDPITQREYYQMTAALDGVRPGSRQVNLKADPVRADQIRGEIEKLRQELLQLEQKVRERVTAKSDSPLLQAGVRGSSLPQSETAEVPRGESRKVRAAPLPLARWSFDRDLKDSMGGLDGTATGDANVNSGRLVVAGNNSFVATVPLKTDLRSKTLEAWVRLDNLDQRGGGAISVQTLDGGTFDAIVFGEREPGRWMAGSNVFQRTKSFRGPAETDAADRAVHVAIAYHADGTIAAYRDGKPYGEPYKSSGPVTFAAGKAQVVFGLRHSPPGGNKMLAGSIEAAQLYDRALSAEEVARSAAAAAEGVSVDQLIAAMTPAEHERRAALQAQIAAKAAALPQAKPLSTYAVTPRPPGVAHVLLRGNPAALGEEVAADGIQSLVGLDADFGLPPDASDVDRRKQLAEWITDPASPLFARVIANRLWHHHFGVGLVETPNDFGFNGGRPSHPELIDYLAGQLVRSGWSLKSLHRLIVTSATYRQSSIAPNPQSAMRNPHSVDANNRLLWRYSPQRLEAEALRDTVLSVAGELNEQMAGPGYRDFDTFTHNTQFYVMKDPVGPQYNRRSVYRTWIRSGRNRFLDVFDCPDPSTKTPQRAVTVTPLQALALMNNSFVLRMSERLADRLRRDAGEDVHDQVRRAYQLAYNRNPDEEESSEAAAFVAAHGLTELCRVILNSNEFLYVD